MSLAFTLVCLDPAAALAVKPSQAFLAQYAATIKQALQSDAEMNKQMDLVARKLDQFHERTGHLPRTPQEKEFFTRIIAKYIVGNPYRPKTVDRLEEKQIDEPYTVPLHLLTDSGLTVESVRQCAKVAPASWRGEPGSIYVLTNGEDLYVVWAASADCLPVRDFTRVDQRPCLFAKHFRPSETVAN